MSEQEYIDLTDMQKIDGALKILNSIVAANQPLITKSLGDTTISELYHISIALHSQVIISDD